MGNKRWHYHAAFRSPWCRWRGGLKRGRRTAGRLLKRAPTTRVLTNPHDYDRATGANVPADAQVRPVQSNDTSICQPIAQLPQQLISAMQLWGIISHKHQRSSHLLLKHTNKPLGYKHRSHFNTLFTHRDRELHLKEIKEVFALWHYLQWQLSIFTPQNLIIVMQNHKNIYILTK